MDINAKLKHLRKQKGINQDEAAELLGVSLSSYQKYEREKNSVTPSLEVLIKIADFYGVTTDYLLGREPLDNPLAGLNITVNDVPLIEEYKKFPDYMKQMFVEAMERLSNAAKQEQGKKRIEERLGDLEDEQAKNADETSSA